MVPHNFILLFVFTICESLSLGMVKLTLNTKLYIINLLQFTIFSKLALIFKEDIMAMAGGVTLVTVFALTIFAFQVSTGCNWKLRKMIWIVFPD